MRKCLLLPKGQHHAIRFMSLAMQYWKNCLVVLVSVALFISQLILNGKLCIYYDKRSSLKLYE